MTAAGRRRAGPNQGAVDGRSRICDSPVTHPGTPEGPCSAAHSRACGPRILSIHSSRCGPTWRRGPLTRALLGLLEATAQSVDLHKQRPRHPDLVQHAHDRERRDERDEEEDGARRGWRLGGDRQQAESKLEDSQRHAAPQSKGPLCLAPLAQLVEKPRSPGRANTLRPTRRTRVTTHGLSLVARRHSGTAAPPSSPRPSSSSHERRPPSSWRQLPFPMRRSRTARRKQAGIPPSSCGPRGIRQVAIRPRRRPLPFTTALRRPSLPAPR